MTFVVPQRSTNGSTYNRAGLSAEETDVAMAQLDCQHHAFNCSNQKVKYFMTRRSVFSVHNEPPHLMVGKFFFKRWQDFQGKRVNIGNPSFGHHGTMEVLMAAHGMSASAFGQIRELDSTMSGQALCDGPWSTHWSFRTRVYPW